MFDLRLVNGVLHQPPNSSVHLGPSQGMEPGLLPPREPAFWVLTSPSGSQEEVDFGRDSLAAGGRKVLSLSMSVMHVAPYCLHHVAAATHPLLAQLVTGTFLHMASTQWEERDKAGHETILDYVGPGKTTYRGVGGYQLVSPLAQLQMVLWHSYTTHQSWRWRLPGQWHPRGQKAGSPHGPCPPAGTSEPPY